MPRLSLYARTVLLYWIRCLLWAAPRAALWAAILYGSLSWFIGALREEQQQQAERQAEHRAQQNALMDWEERNAELRATAMRNLAERCHD